MKDGDQGLIERIESLEEEVEKQRILLRYALRGGGLAQQFPDESEERRPEVEYRERAVARREVGGRGSMADEPSVDRGEVSGVEDGGADGGETGALADLFRLRGWEWWLNKVGIGLLLFGVAFLFKFSVDQGWLSPVVRVGFGLFVGGCLLAAGLRVYEGRRAFSQVLIGGGIGTFYITGFAAYSLYALVPHALAFVFMAATTLLAFLISIRQDQAALSIIGAVGGFGTPFLLYTEAGSTGGLVLYTGLLLVGTVAIYCYKGWRPLLLISTAGMWMVLLIGYANAGGLGAKIPGSEAFALQVGVVLAFAIPWLGSLGRAALYPEDPGSTIRATRSPAHVHLISVSAPLVFVSFTAALWSLSTTSAGWVAGSMAGVYVLAYGVLKYSDADELAYTHVLSALLLVTLAAALLLEGHALFVTLAVEAVVLHLVARKISDRLVAALAHGIFAVVGLWFIGRIAYVAWDTMFTQSDRMAFLNIWMLADFVALIAAVASSLLFGSSRTSAVYKIAAHAGFLALVWREFSLVPEANAYVTITWGAYAVVLVVAGLQWGRPLLRQLGFITLFLVVGKLFLVDLVWVDALWRILLFLGFGGAFLILSYYLQALWRQGVHDRNGVDFSVGPRKEE